MPSLLLAPVAAYSQPAISFPESFLWNAESRGPLLVVLPLSEKDGQLVTCGSLTAFAPKSYLTLKWEHLPEPDLFGQMGQEEKWELFQASLTERQWKLLGSAAGLGQTDLAKDQKKLFFTLLPDPMTVVGNNGQSVVLTPELRRGTHLRLSRNFVYGFTNNDGRQVTSGGLPSQMATEWRLASPTKPQPTFLGEIPGITFRSTINDLVNPGRRQTTDSANFGAKLVEPSGTHLKPSELDLASPTLDPFVSLTGATTVGELVKRVSDATKRELFCDPRYAQQRVYLRGDKARAGDVLKALCWGVSGTFRRVADAYVLTEDLVPLALRLGKIADWRKAAQQRIAALRVSDELQLARYHQSYLAYKNTTHTLSTAWRYGQRVPLRELSPALRSEIQQQMELWALAPSSDPNRAPLNRTFINVTPRVQLDLLVPNVGAVPASWGDHPIAELPDDTPSGRLPVPTGGPPRTLAVSVASPAKARQAVRWAKSGGFTALWVQIGLSDTALLEAAIAAGKAEGIPVSALVRPLRAPGPMEQTVEAKRSSVYLRPDLLESQAAVLPQLKQLAATPNLAGLVFTDLNPTGYVDHASVEWNEILGYSQEMRLACLRQNGPDPVDLSDSGSGVDGNLAPWIGYNARLTESMIIDTSFLSPYRPTLGSPWFSASPANVWQAFIDVRTKAVDGFVEGLTTAIHESVPRLPVLRSKGEGWDVIFGPLRRFSLTTNQAVLTWNDFIGQWRGLNARKPEGLVFDGTLVSLSQLTPLLGGLENP